MESAKTSRVENQRSFLNAVKWSYTSTWGERAFSAIFTFVLAAMLGPKDFGTVAIALVYIGFLQMFLDQGFVAALIQRKQLDPEHLDAVFWMDLVLSFGLIGVSTLLSGWWAAKNHAPQLAVVINVLSLCIPIEGLAVIQKTLLSRDMDFKSLSIRSNASVLISGVVGIGMAYSGCGVWALVGQQVARDLTALLLLWRLSPWRPRLQFSWKHLRELMSFSVSNFIAQLGIFADASFGATLLGLFFGPVAVGLYRLADRLTYSVVAMATSSIQAVSLPEFSRLQDDPERLRKSVLSCIKLSSTVTLPALAGMAAVSAPLMATLGPNWAPASDVLRVLCVTGMVFILSFFTGPLLQALYKTHQLAVLEWIRTAVGIASLVAAGLWVRNAPVNWQIMGIALARFTTVTFFIAPVFVYILMRLSGVTFSDFIYAVAPSASASVGVVVAVEVFHSVGWPSAGRPVVLLTTEVAVGLAIGLPLLLLLDVQLRTAIVGLAKKALGVAGLAKKFA